MKTLRITLAMLIVGTGAAMAQDTLDIDGDGYVTIEELVAAYPEMTEGSFSEADTDDDGALSEAEVMAALEAGLIPTEM